VRSRARARTAGGSDPLAGLDPVADADAPAGEVRVQRRVAVSDRDLDEVAVALIASLLPNGEHASGLCCSHSEGA
jgi:hypothetical protein